MSRQIVKNVYFENDFLIDREFIKKAVKRPCIPFARPLEVTSLISMIAAIILFVTRLAVNLIRFDGNGSTLVILTTMALIWVAIRIRILPAVRIRSFYNAIGGTDVRYHYSFEDDAFLQYADNGKNGAESYYHVNSITDDGDAFVLRVNMNGIIRIPKNSFTYGDPNEFFHFMTERTFNSQRASNSGYVINIILNIVMTVVFIVASLGLILTTVFPVAAMPTVFPAA